MRASLVCLIVASVAAGCAMRGERVAHPAPVAVTRPAPVNQTQDCAFWIHPTDPARSLILVTNERRGLEVHDVHGTLLKHLDEGICPQYVDVLYDVATASGPRDLVLATTQAEASLGASVWAVDREKSKLIYLVQQPTLPVLNGTLPLGLFGYRSAASGKSYIFVTNGENTIEQHEVVPAEQGEGVELKLVRAFTTEGGKSKGGVADAEHGVIYAACDKTGVWRYDAEPNGSTQGTLVIPVNEHGLLPNVRGPALYRTADGGGYLILAGQGHKGDATELHVYDHLPPYTHRLTIQPAAGAFELAEHSSGLDVTSLPLAPDFPGGVLALNDQQTANGSEDFKLYAWSDVARAAGLKTRGISPRPPASQPTTQPRVGSS